MLRAVRAAIQTGAGIADRPWQASLDGGAHSIAPKRG